MNGIIELEIKFQVEQDQAMAWLQKLHSSEMAKSRIEVHFVRSTYYDTVDLHIHRQLRSSLRHRMNAGRQDLTLKSDFLPSDTVLVRKEITQSLETGCDIDTAIARLCDTHIGNNLTSPCRPVFCTDIIRHKLLVSHGSAEIEVVYDRGDIRSKCDGDRHASISEIEFEKVSGSDGDLFDFIAKQLSGQEWVQLSYSKAQRGYALVNKSERFRPRKHHPIASEGLDPGQLFMANMHASVQHLLDNNPVYLKDKPNAIHQTRVAIRRIRAILRLFKDQLSYFDRKALNGELRWLQAKLGVSRDWYVLYSETLSRMDFLSDKELEHIEKVARFQHERELKKGLAIYRSARAQRLITHIQGWLARDPLRPTLSIERLRYKAFKRNTIRLQAIGDVIASFHEDLQDVHATRIIGKKFRYALEIFPSTEDQKLVANLAQMQEYLGTVNDIDRALNLILTHDKISLSARTRNKLLKWGKQQASIYVHRAVPHLDAIIAHDISTPALTQNDCESPDLPYSHK